MVTKSLADYIREDQDILFSDLKRLRRIVDGARVGRSASSLSIDRFEFLSDHLIVVQPHTRFGRYRIQYYGPVWTAATDTGDCSDLDFSEMIYNASIRRALLGYKHVALTKHPFVIYDQPYPSATSTLYTRFLVPIMHRGRIAKIIGASVFHTRPIRAALWRAPAGPSLARAV